MSEGFNVSRGSIPGWLSCAVIVLGIVGFFTYERASDEKWMALEDQSFAGIERRLDAIEHELIHIRGSVSEHRGAHNAAPVYEPLPYPPTDRHP